MGKQIVVLRCGRHLPPGDEESSGRTRLAGRLRLPPWAQAPIDSKGLQRPLLRTTWVWLGAHGIAQAASDVFRPVQVPALLIEERLGLPLLLVLGGNVPDYETFDREAFLAALATAVGVDRGRLALARVTRGSIIADLQLLSPCVEDIERIHAAQAVLCACVGQEFACGIFGTLETFELPGIRALRRVLQWRLAGALEAVANGAPDAHKTAAAVVALARSP